MNFFNKAFFNREALQIQQAYDETDAHYKTRLKKRIKTQKQSKKTK